jgi:hypothetical protein
MLSKKRRDEKNVRRRFLERVWEWKKRNLFCNYRLGRG